MVSLSLEEMSKYVSSYYSKLISNTFAHNGSLATKWARLRVSHVLDLLGEIRHESRILDAGCGMGTFTSLLSKKAQIVGIDFSKEAMKATKFVVTRYGNKSRVELIRCDVQFLPFRKNIFDNIVAADLVEHLHKNQYIKFQQECGSVLKQDGVLAIYTPNPINIISPYSYLKMRYPFHPMHVGLQSPISLCKTLIKYGFKVRKIHCVETLYSQRYLSNLVTKINKLLWVFPFILGGRTCIRAQKG